MDLSDTPGAIVDGTRESADEENHFCLFLEGLDVTFGRVLFAMLDARLQILSPETSLRAKIILIGIKTTCTHGFKENT